MAKIGNYLLVEKDGDTYTLHMTPELQDDVGTVGFVDYTAGETVEKDSPFVSLEASKTVLEVRTPLSGKVLATNEAAEDEPSLLNSAKKEENWLIKLTDVDEAEYNALEEA